MLQHFIESLFHRPVPVPIPPQYNLLLHLPAAINFINTNLAVPIEQFLFIVTLGSRGQSLLLLHILFHWDIPWPMQLL